MKNNKLNYIIIVLIFGVCVVSIYFSLKNISSKMDEDTNDTDNDNQIIDLVPTTNDVENINEFVNYVKTYEITNRSDYANKYNIYYINNGVLSGYNYNTTNGEFLNNLSYEFGEEKGFYNGQIFTKDDSSIYFSINNNEKCFVKPLESEEIEVYDVSESDKCHKVYIFDDELKAELLVYNSVTGALYNEGEISDSSLRFSILTNLLDMDAATYKWYRNGVLVENNSSSSLLIENDEDGTYYVEIVSFDGKTAKSRTVTIKIKK